MTRRDALRTIVALPIVAAFVEFTTPADDCSSISWSDDPDYNPPDAVLIDGKWHHTSTTKTENTYEHASAVCFLCSDMDGGCCHT